MQISQEVANVSCGLMVGKNQIPAKKPQSCSYCNNRNLEMGRNRSISLSRVPMTTIVYTSQNCPGCATLKAKLKAEGKDFIEMKIGQDVSMEDFQKQHPGIRTVPYVVTLPESGNVNPSN